MDTNSLPLENSPVTTPATPQTVSLAPKQSSNKLWYLVILLLLLLLVSSLANLAQYLGLIKHLDGVYSYLPLKPANIQNLKDFGFYYYFEADLLEIKPASTPNALGDPELITNVSGPNIPRFFVGPQTEIFVTENNIYRRVEKEQLKVGQKLGFMMNYYQLKNWGIPRITILQ